MLPSAVGVAISPIPIIAVVLMLVTPRGRMNGPAFVLGWWLGLALVGTVVLLVAGGASATEDGEPATWVAVVELVLGLLLLLVAFRQWRSRPREGVEAPMPKWMQALDTFTPPKALGAGAVLAGANPKNLLLTVAGATAIAQVGIPGGEEAVALAAFILIASIGVALPVVLALAMGDRSRALLDSLKGWMGRNNAVIMVVLLTIIGAKLIGDAISGFAS
jgi:threonine/homoserine/homoserine lactone efflux protein